MTTKLNTVKSKKVKFAQKKFHIGIISPLNTKRNVDLLFRAVEPLCEIGFSLSVLAIGDKEAQEECFKLSQKYPGQFEVLESIPGNKEKILKSSQVVCFMSQPESDLIKEVTMKGIVPIMPEGADSNFENFSAQQETGNAFLFDEENFWEFLATIIRAYENYKFPYDWNNLKKTVQETGEAL